MILGCIVHNINNIYIHRFDENLMFLMYMLPTTYIKIGIIFIFMLYNLLVSMGFFKKNIF